MAYQIQLHLFEIRDHVARIQWGRLLGFEVKYPEVKITHDFYEKNMGEIHSIMGAQHFRQKP